jgi:dTDP-glucose 4,6-dehydratase
MRLLVTGGAGFIGSNFIRHILAADPACQVINYDKLTYAGNLENLKDIEKHPRYAFVHGDICDRILLGDSIRKYTIDAIINFAAETHVDRSIAAPQDFLETDILGTYTLLDAVKQHGVKKFIQVGTDEVYGDYDQGGYAAESAPVKPSSPYSASKAGADLQVLAYHRTYGLPVIITRCTNNYGPYQYPEKMLPLFITNLLEKQKVPMYGDGQQIRDWLYVDDHCRALALVLQKGQEGNIYNIGANQNPEVTNKELTQKVLAAMQLDERWIEYVTDRKGHDRRYAVDCTKIKALGWSVQVSFAEGLHRTITWYRENEAWWKKIKSGAYKEYYRTMYHQ